MILGIKEYVTLRMTQENCQSPNIFVDDGQIAGGCYIVNNERGLSDSRYSKVSNEWVFTGTYVALSESDILNNTPIDVEIWGGDCSFLSTR